MKTIYYYYVRHGETVFNLENRMQGITDSPLTAKGIRQIEQTARALENITFQAAYASPLPRTVQTAEIVLKPHDMQATIFEPLHEFSYGSWDGNVKNEDDAMYRYRFANDLFDDLGGENPVMIRQRIKDAFDVLRMQNQNNDHILIVSHGAYFRHLLFSLMSDSIPDSLRNQECLIANGGIAVLKDEDGKFTLTEGPLMPEEYIRNHV